LILFDLNASTRAVRAAIKFDYLFFEREEEEKKEKNNKNGRLQWGRRCSVSSAGGPH